MKKKQVVSLLLAATLMGSSVFSGIATLDVSAATKRRCNSRRLADNNTNAPEKDKVIPSANQYKYQKDELAAFCHFGMNTYTGSEWGMDRKNRNSLH